MANRLTCFKEVRVGRIAETCQRARSCFQRLKRGPGAAECDLRADECAIHVVDPVRRTHHELFG